MNNLTLPDTIETEAALEDVLAQPSERLVATMAELPGDLMIIGVGGKMGPSLAHLARRACDAAGPARRVIGVSRFSNEAVRQQIESWGVETVSCDLLDPACVADLPDAPNIVFMAGRKFGSTGAEALTWAMNAYVPGLIAQRFRGSRLVVFSSGNVYPLVPVIRGGAAEGLPPAPVGEYAQSVLARERMFEYFSGQCGSPGTTIRLNYAVDLRYGVLVDIARKVDAGQPIDVTMGHVNVIWQGDANSYALLAFSLCATPPALLNVTGPEAVPVRWLAEQFGELLGKKPDIRGEEADTALLNNAARCFSLFGYPRVPLQSMVRWVADWVRRGGSTLGKPTHFEARDGRF